MTTRPEPTITDKCGTWTGYKRHSRKKEQKCEACAKIGKKVNAKKYANNREKRLLQQKQYRLKNENLVKERKKRYYRENKEKVRAGIKRWESQNRDKVLQYQRQWHANNKDKSRANSLRMAHKRNAIKRKSKSEPYTEKQVINLYGINCYLCKKEIDFIAPRTPRLEGWHFGLHIDHVVPISRGGEDVISNVRPVHAICNLKKASKVDEEYTRMAAKVFI
jgi:5-methylcytosine-specific restriction endonuclease McrA